MEKLLSPQDVMRIASLGRTTVYALFHRGDFPTVKIGKKLYVTAAAFQAWLERGGTEQK